MAEVHTIAGARDRHENLAVEGARRLGFTEEQQPAYGHERHAECVVDPCRLPHHNKTYAALNGETAARGKHTGQETTECDGEARKPAGKADEQCAAPRQLAHEAAQIEAKKHVTDETAEVVERTIVVPARLAPQRVEGLMRQAGTAVDDGQLARSGPVANEGNEGGQQAQHKVERQLAVPHALGPGREQWHQQVDTQEHIDEPQMARGIVKVEQQVAEVLNGLAPRQSIDHRPHHERHQHALQTAAEKLAGGVVERKLQVA